MAELVLTKGYRATIDDEDLPLLSRWKWSALLGRDGRVYAKRNDRGTIILLHRFLLGVTDPAQRVDHRDNDGLNNHRSNIRVCTQAQNLGNQRPQRRAKASRFKGVSWHKQKYGRSRWTAYIHYDKRRHFIGLFDSEEDAARAYDDAAREHFGEFAYLNFPVEVA